MVIFESINTLQKYIEWLKETCKSFNGAQINFLIPLLRFINILTHFQLNLIMHGCW